MFNPHCDFTIEVKNNIMFCTMQGAWNIEGAGEYFAAIKQHAQPLLQDSWCRIALTENFEGGPLEIMEMLKEIQDWSLANNCLCLFIVAPRAFNKMVLDKHQNGYAQVNYVATLEDAIEQANMLLSLAD